MATSNHEIEYQMKGELEHIIDIPDTFIGSIEKVEGLMWVADGPDKIVQRTIHYIPGFYNLCNEGFVNASDHAKRMEAKIKQNTGVNLSENLKVTDIEITIDANGRITMMNNGNGIDIAEHPIHKMWIPQMIFGYLRTSTNYNKDEKKITGGKNGFGIKLVSIFSTSFVLETVDHIRGLKYVQEFSKNLSVIGKPSITKSKLKPYTKISFIPDYNRFDIPGIDDDMMSLLRKRVYDIAALTDKSIKVKFNNEVVPVKNFKQYIDMYIGAEAPRVYEEGGERWEFAVALHSEFAHVSFVNGINTIKGGKHVEYILNQITRGVSDYVEKKKKVKVTPNSIKDQLILFIRCDIENPAFDSQTKEFMNTPSSKFGSKCDVSEKFIEKVAKMGVMDAACALMEIKDNKAAKKSDGSKTKNVRGIPKLTDANWAGTEKSDLCILLVVEGDSAKAGVISGMQSKDRDIYGIYPLKGKVFNVRGELAKRVAENKEISDLKKTLGLELNKVYTSAEDVKKNLRYSKVVFLTDQDSDGSHIKGLCVNLFQSEWPSLLEVPGFIGFMNTPILKAKKGSTEILFYNDGEYEEWKKLNDVKSWHVKYYKGLGTSTGKEFREYFDNKKFVDFVHTGKESDDSIDMVFNKKRADDRKGWLGLYDREAYLDTNKKEVTYPDFINRELIHFSKYDCDRSIPNLMDGLKISLRKILFAAFKKNLTTEIKVAQFSGYVSEHSCYHHGEESLNQAIKGMAQNFVGSNNINLLVPSGQFGTRLKGGEDSASPRYIFTLLNKVTRMLFPLADDAILSYLDDDGTIVEPIFYAPIIPMLLVNGSKGIGTGFSTDVMCYNPNEIVNYLKAKLRNEEYTQQFVPFYDGFTGTIEKISESKFMIRGKYETLATDKIRVIELPIGYWTDNFKEHLESLIETDQIKDYQDMSRDTNVDFTIVFSKGKLSELELVKLDHGCNGVDKLLKLMTTHTTTNMHAFDAKDKLRKFEKVEEMIDMYFETRLDLYNERKKHQIVSLQGELKFLSNKAKYIQANLDGSIDLRKKSKEQVLQLLSGFDKMNDDADYKYLTKMTMDSVTEENVTRLFNEHKQKSDDLDILQKRTIQEMWLSELEDLQKELNRKKIIIKKVLETKNKIKK